MLGCFLPLIVSGSAAGVKSYLLAPPQGKQIIPLSTAALGSRARRKVCTIGEGTSEIQRLVIARQLLKD